MQSITLRKLSLSCALQPNGKHRYTKLSSMTWQHGVYFPRSLALPMFFKVRYSHSRAILHIHTWLWHSCVQFCLADAINKMLPDQTFLDENVQISFVPGGVRPIWNLKLASINSGNDLRGQWQLNIIKLLINKIRLKVTSSTNPHGYWFNSISQSLTLFLSVINVSRFVLAIAGAETCWYMACWIENMQHSCLHQNGR